jgi:hypothetical protein
MSDNEHHNLKKFDNLSARQVAFCSLSSCHLGNNAQRFSSDFTTNLDISRTSLADLVFEVYGQSSTMTTAKRHGRVACIPVGYSGGPWLKLWPRNRLI